MPMKLSVGVSKKLGLPDYGSYGATCHVELELDQVLTANDPDGLQRQACRAFAACRQAVHDELARQQGQSAETSPVRTSDAPAGTVNRNNGAGNGSGSHRASQKQLDYANQLARQIRGLGTRRLESLAGKMYGKPLADLGSLEASGLIDTLKAIKEGRIQLEDALQGAAP